MFLLSLRRLDALSRCAWETVRDPYCAYLENGHAPLGMVVSIPRCGDLANRPPRSPPNVGEASVTLDPLRWPCFRTMRVITFILDTTVIRKIMLHRPRP